MTLPSHWWFFLLWAFGAEVIGTIAGFGAATILTPIAACFMEIKMAIAVVACFHLFGNASRLIFFGRSIHWPTWAQFGLTGVACSFLGARLAVRWPSATLTFVLGVFLLLYVVASLAAAERMRLPATRGTLMLGGASSGLIAGLIGTGGAIRSACLLAFGLPKEVYLGTSAALALVVDATRVPVYLSEHLLVGRGLGVASLILVAFAGSWLGQRVVRRVAAHAFHRFILVMLALMGCKFLVDGWRGL